MTELKPDEVSRRVMEVEEPVVAAVKAAERFFTHPKHRECIERWYPIVDPPPPYSMIGNKR